MVAGTLAALGLIAPATAAAEGTPNISLVKTQPAQALIGTQQEVHLTASNPPGEERGYNLSFRDVLPKGVAYVPGSAGSLEPKVIGDPTKEPTTLIFENLADLSANSKYNLSFKVEPLPSTFQITKLHEYTDHAEAFVNKEPRFKPSFAANGEVIAGSFTGKGTANATTELTAVEIVKSEPSPEGEILRGVHEHQTVYTLTVKNNHVGPTSELEVEDLLPAGLEFLGCGTVDNTTDTKTNPGQTEEYAGSGPIDPGHAPSAPECAKHEPYFVGTVLNPPGHPTGVYTQVKWKNLPELAASQEFQIQYVAAIPILKNAMTWQDGIEPTAESLKQAANLDNNTGAETVDEEALTNFAEVHGKYEEVAVKDTDEMTRTAEDLAIQKTVTPTKIEEGEISTWTLDLEASEYRFVNGVEIDDLLPNGLCPLGKENHEGPQGAPKETTEECEPVPGVEPTYEIEGVPGGPQPAEYTSVEEQPNGSFKIHWDETKFPQLAQLSPSEHLTLKFPTRTRIFYQNEFENDESKPILTGDSWTNHVETQGDDFARCAPNDPLCAKGEPKIFHEETEGTPDFDVSEASQAAGGVEIDKTVRKNEGLVPENCSGNYVEGTSAPFPLYAPGDEICWTLRVKFAAKLYAGSPVVTDFIPTDEEYVPNSAIKAQAPKAPEGANTLEATFNEAAALAGEPLQWTLGAAVESGTQIFEWRFKTKVKKESETKPQEITGNLMKFVYSNTLGETFPLRDRAEVEREEPELELVKGVTELNGTAVPGAPAKSVEIHGSDEAKFAVDLSNHGNMEAEGTEVWDVLPEGMDCTSADVHEISPGGVCEGTKIVWQGISVPTGGASVPLTYVVKVPTDVAPGHIYTNKAGVTHFETPTNTGETFKYIPEENLDPAEAGKENTKPLVATASIHTWAATLTKEATTETSQGGNKASQATIGEIVDYEVKATIPGGSTLYGSPVLEDNVPASLEVLPGAAGSLNGAALSTGGLSLTQAGNKFTVNFPTEYANPAGNDILILTFKARVLNNPVNVRGATITNEATFHFADKEGAAAAVPPANVNTPVVEPLLLVEKTTAASAGKVKPGEPITFKVKASVPKETGEPKKTDVSTANEVRLVDTIPTGMKVVNPGSATLAGQTLTWKVKEIEPGKSVTFEYEAEIEKEALATSSFTNSVVGTTQSLLDKAPGELAEGTRTATFAEGAYKAAEQGYEAEGQATVQLIGATIGKTVEPKEGTIGTPLTYTLHLHLPPNIKFSNTTIVDTLPDGVAYDKTISKEVVEGATKTPAGEELTEKPEGSPERFGWYFGNLPSSPVERELVVVFEGHVKAKFSGGAEVKSGAELTNSVVGLYNGESKSKPVGVPTPGAGSGFTEETNPATAVTKVDEPVVNVAKSVTIEPGGGAGPEVQPGDSFIYKLVVTNSGNWPAYGVKVTDNNPQGDLRNITPLANPNATVLTTNPLSWEITGPIAKETGSVTLEYEVEIAPSAELHNGDAIDNIAAIPSYLGVPKAAQKTGVEYRTYKGNESPVPLDVALPQLVLHKTTGPNGAKEEFALIGEEFEWRLEANNESPAASIEGVDLLDKLPKGWKYVEGSAEVVPGGAHPTPTATHTAPGEEEELSWQNVADLGPAGNVKLNFKAIPTTELVGQEGTFTNHATASGEDRSGATASAEGPYSSSDTAVANLQTPPLTIVKKPDAGEAAAKAVAGEPSVYTIEVVNGGEATATEVNVTDLLDLGNGYAAGSATASPPAGFNEVGTPETVEPEPGVTKTKVAWQIASIGPKGKVTITVPVSIAASLAAGTALHDTASVDSKQQPIPVSDGGTLEVEREADLEIVKTETSGEVIAGKDVEYNLHVVNHGPSDAEAAKVSDPIPAGTKFVSADTPCGQVGAEISCELGNLPAGFEHDYKVKLEVLSSNTGTLVNRATIGSPTFDPEPGESNESEVESPIETRDELSVVKRGPEQPVLLGSTFEYELEVQNAGPSDAEGVEVKDQLPPQEELVEAEAPCEEGLPGEVTCALGTLPAGAPPTLLHFTVKAIGIPAGGEPVVNHATVESTTVELTNSEGEAKTTVLPAADLAITKTAPATVEPNGDVTYNLHVEDLGPSVAHKVLITDPLPAGTTFVSAGENCEEANGVVFCTPLVEGAAAGELAVGEAVDFQVTVHVPYALGGQPLTNTASVEGEEGDPNTQNDQSTVTTTVGPDADLSITKTMGQAQAGEPLTYTLAVTNHGPSDSNGVTVKDTLPAGATFKSAAPSQGSCTAAGQAVTCELGPLASGGSAQVSITVEVAATVTGNIRNVATVEGPLPDPDKSNNENAVEGPVAPAPPSAPNLRVVKTADTSTPQVGTPFHYTVAISNLRGAEAKQVKMVDTLNGPARVLGVQSQAGHCEVAGSKITCTIPSIAVGKTVRITYTVVAEATGPLSNTASAEAKNGETAPANNHAVKDVKAMSGRASYSLTKTAASKTVGGGKTVGFTITLRNGRTALVGATVCDRLPAALVFVKAAGATFVKGEACWQKKYVAPHKVLKLHLVARAVRGYKARTARNVASATAENGPRRSAAATVRIKPAFAGAPGGVTG